MKLVHYTYEWNKINKLVSQHQESNPERKPRGLWVSDEDDYGWTKACRDREMFRDEFEIAHYIYLKDDAKILYLRSCSEIDEFTQKYSSKSEYEFLNNHAIDWESVAKEYQGIIITPYCYNWGMMRTSPWYYGWDCASGCIWDVNCVKKMIRRKVSKRVKAIVRG